VLLLRHASAGERLSSPSIDQFRQLDRAGRADARQLIWSLADQEIERVVTSPLTRCIETVIPIAESRRLVVEHRNALLPEAHPDAVLELLEDLPNATLVCTHREVMLQLFEGEMRCEKGGAWVLERAGSLWSPTEYLPPPSSVTQEAFPRTALSR
jgi:phosphohistidine phosphatase SixA